MPYPPRASTMEAFLRAAEKHRLEGVVRSAAGRPTGPATAGTGRKEIHEGPAEPSRRGAGCLGEIGRSAWSVSSCLRTSS